MTRGSGYLTGLKKNYRQLFDDNLFFVQQNFSYEDECYLLREAKL